MKIFGIGFNKTGTTSLLFAMKKLKFKLGKQRTAELLFPYYKIGNFEQLFKYCENYNFFQDVPFSLPHTFEHVDLRFPGSKFILTVRNNSKQWYESVVRFHSLNFGNGKTPTAEMLKQSKYAYQGFAWDVQQFVFKVEENDPYCRNKLIKVYENHNQSIMNYFKNRPNNLLVLNVAEEDAGSNDVLQNLRQGHEGSWPKQFTRVADAVFFTADDGVHGEELWITDGTAQGTRLVRDISLPGDLAPRRR